MFSITKHYSPAVKADKCSGMHMQFANGYIISIQFHLMAYCSNRGKTSTDACRNAEVAIFSPHGFYRMPDWTHDDDVIGWQTTDDVAQIIAHVSALPPVDNSDQNQL